MNAKLAKRIRRVVNERVKEFGVDVTCAPHADVPVKSKHGLLKNTETGEIVRGALQRRLQEGCPRDVYKRIKRHVRQQRKAT